MGITVNDGHITNMMSIICIKPQSNGHNHLKRLEYNMIPRWTTWSVLSRYKRALSLTIKKDNQIGRLENIS
jgi:hypothetical protein